MSKADDIIAIVKSKNYEESQFLAWSLRNTVSGQNALMCMHGQSNSIKIDSTDFDSIPLNYEEAQFLAWSLRNTVSGQNALMCMHGVFFTTDDGPNIYVENSQTVTPDFTFNEQPIDLDNHISQKDEQIVFDIE